MLLLAKFVPVQVVSKPTLHVYIQPFHAIPTKMNYIIILWSRNDLILYSFCSSFHCDLVFIVCHAPFFFPCRLPTTLLKTMPLAVVDNTCCYVDCDTKAFWDIWRTTSWNIVPVQWFLYSRTVELRSDSASYMWEVLWLGLNWSCSKCYQLENVCSVQ